MSTKDLFSGEAYGLSPEIEAYVTRLYRSGDKREREEALTVYYNSIKKLLTTVIKKSVGVDVNDIDFEDYFSEATIIAIQALQNYNPEATEAKSGQKAKLSTYLFASLQNGLKNAKAKTKGDTAHYARTAVNIYKAIFKISQEKGIPEAAVTNLEIAEATGISLATVKNTREGMAASSVNMTDPDETFAAIRGPKDYEPEYCMGMKDTEERFLRGLEGLSEAERYVFLAKSMLEHEPWSDTKLIKELRSKGYPVHSPAQVQAILERARRKMAAHFPEMSLPNGTSRNRRALIRPRRQNFNQ